MSLLENIKKAAERVTGMGRPSGELLGELVRAGRRTNLRFADDGLVPNHPRWPLVLYRGAVKLPRSLDPAAVFEELFEFNDWGDTWRGEIYDYLHYHSKIHEVLGIARGNAKIRFGGDKGRIVALKAGDVVILPAGTGHQSLSASKTFMAVGAYPRSGTYNLCKPTAENHARALKSVPKVPRPRKDPVHGAEGPLLKLWAPWR